MGHTGAVGNPLIANQGMLNFVEYDTQLLQLITHVFRIFPPIKFSTTPKENHGKSDHA